MKTDTITHRDHTIEVLPLGRDFTASVPALGYIANDAKRTGAVRRAKAEIDRALATGQTTPTAAGVSR